MFGIKGGSRGGKEMSNEKQNRLDGSTAFKVIDGDNMSVIRIFHNDRREEMLSYYKNLYGSVSEDVDGDIICFEDAGES